MNKNDQELPNYVYLSSLLAGGVAGLVVDVVLFPIDTVKTRLQSERGFWRSGGFRGVYNGLGPAAVGSVPTAAMFFCTYETVKSVLLQHTASEHAPFVHMTSASLAEMVACLIRVPVEIVKQRRQTLNVQTNGLTVLLRAYQSEGICNGLYRGFGSTLLREIPFSFIQFPIWEYLKANWTETTTLPLTSASVAVCGAIAGGIAAAITTPLDVAKTRIMLAERFDGPKHTAFKILRTIYKEKGLKGIFAGFVPRVMWITLGGAIFFGTYDLASRTFGFREDAAARST